MRLLFLTRFYNSFLATMLLLLIIAPSSWADSEPLSEQQDVQQFIQMMAEKHNFDQAELQTLFKQAEIKQSILKAISHPSEKKPWYFYRDLFITDKRTQEGVSFWRANESTLTRAEQEYGVPAGIIVAILGVETNYGKRQGSYRVLDSLSTLAFAYPPRSVFFKKELEEFLLLSRENKLDPTAVTGSYAGAIGQPQFMPSSYRSYAIDYTHNQQKDLNHSTPDVIASVANYLKANGWQTNEAIATPASVSGEQYKKLSIKRRKPKLTLKELHNYGVQPEQDFSNNQKAIFIKLMSEDHPLYWLGFQNFYVITRYNTSINYAMAVYLLSNQIKALKEG